MHDWILENTSKPSHVNTCKSYDKEQEWSAQGQWHTMVGQLPIWRLEGSCVHTLQPRSGFLSRYHGGQASDRAGGKLLD